MNKIISFILLLIFPFNIVFSQSADVYQDTKNSLKDFKEDYASFKTAVQNHTAHPLDQFRLLEQNITPLTKAIDIDDLEIIIDNQTYSIKDLKGLSFNEGKKLSFAFKGKVFQTFSFHIFSIAFTDDQLAFTTTKSFFPDRNIQNLSVIDFAAFNANLGKTELPIFRLPVTSNEVSYVKAVGNEFMVGDVQIPRALFYEFTQAQFSSFHILSNLLNPETYISTIPLADKFYESFLTQLESASDEVSAQVNPEQKDIIRNEVITNLKETYELNKELITNKANYPKENIAKNIQKNFDYKVKEQVSSKTKEIAESIKGKSKLMLRTHVLGMKLHIPNPLGSVERVKSGLMSLYGITSGTITILGTGAIAYLGIEHMLGIHFSDMLKSIFELNASIGEWSFGPISDIAYLTKEAIKDSFAGFNPYILHKTYIANGNWAKTSVGLTAMVGVIYTALGVPHLLVNLSLLVKDMSENARLKGYSLLEFITNLRTDFITRQEQEEAKYQKLMTGDAKESSPEDRAKALAYLESIKKEPGIIQKWFNALTDNSVIEKVKSSLGFKKNIMSLPSAIGHFLFSYASFTHSGYVYSLMWNAWFGFRSFVLSPKYFFSFLYFPRLFTVATYNPFHQANNLNGGRRSIIKNLLMKDIRTHLNTSISNVFEFEEKYMTIESLIYTQAMNRAKDALINKLTVQENQAFIKMGGVPNLDAPQMAEVSIKHKLYYFAYFKNAFNNASEKFAEVYLQKEMDENLDNFKSRSLTTLQNFDSKNIDWNLIFDQKNLSSAHLAGNTLAESKSYSIDNMKAQFELDYYKNISPKYNKQVDRMKTVTRQIENPGALARGVRSMIAANIIDKPLELMTTFIVSAGITSGIMMPIQPEMFSADSWFYLSRYVFLNGMVFSTITSVLSHVWMKVQMDTLNEGNFDQIPEGNEKKLSFMQWFYKKGIKDSNNSWWANQKHYNKIITANLKAAFVMTTTFNLLSMHRFDLDSYLTGYIFAYCFLSNGLYAKIEQAFDLSTGWFAKDIPKDILNTPEIKSHLNAQITKSRLMFNFVYRNFENITGYFFGNLINMGTPKLGGRSFARIIFGGNTPTNLLSNVFEKTGEKIPFIKPLTNLCNAFFSNGYKEK